MVRVLSRELVEFLQKCKEHNNPEIIYREVDEVVNNFRVPAKAGHMESSYTVGLLVLVTPTEGEDDAMEFINCEGNREWYFSWDLAGDYSDTVSTGEVYLLFNVFNSRSVYVNVADVCGFKSCLWFEGIVGSDSRSSHSLKMTDTQMPGRLRVVKA
ncbi:unnamed protein product [Prunus armeniaca]|uniref:At2g35280-like TPR domain-containing protein n=1 Tax=Prunus armeniaca TaxID=36596 RepID=A0A6J5WEE9_PRUAR|nr:unnamed protein product [Prunus armeniaca]